MNELNKISIKQYLSGINIHPVKDYGYYGMYHCPFRSDNNASFKVDYNKNVWHDFGINEGGTMIDLVMKMKNCSFHEAVSKLEKEYAINPDSFSFHRKPVFDEVKSDAPVITIQNIIPITHPQLVSWVQERKIDLNLANLYCREIHYRNRDKDYFSIGFKNDKGGYELNSPSNFKGCIAPKDITTIRNNSNICLVFEGFWDFLSYLTIQKTKRSKYNVAILNSVANVQKVMDFLKTHKEIYTYLDNDDAGRKATELIQSANSTMYNRSIKYADFKDLNDYLCQKPMVKPGVKKKKLGLKR
ncbi:MAG: toprim domain-containing protein [Prevotellaceae bacterium]|nr:toprim domain-containing protein [Prevotellaceae bacterium]